MEEMMEDNKKFKDEDMKIMAIILAIIFPPLGVAIREGLGFSLVVNLILTSLFWIPGLIHALWVIMRR